MGIKDWISRRDEHRPARSGERLAVRLRAKEKAGYWGLKAEDFISVEEAQRYVQSPAFTAFKEFVSRLKEMNGEALGGTNSAKLRELLGCESVFNLGYGGFILAETLPILEAIAEGKMFVAYGDNAPVPDKPQWEQRRTLEDLAAQNILPYSPANMVRLDQDLERRKPRFYSSESYRTRFNERVHIYVVQLEKREPQHGEGNAHYAPYGHCKTDRCWFTKEHFVKGYRILNEWFEANRKSPLEAGHFVRRLADEGKGTPPTQIARP